MSQTDASAFGAGLLLAPGPLSYGHDQAYKGRDDEYPGGTTSAEDPSTTGTKTG